MIHLLNVLSESTRLYSTQARKNCVGFVSCSHVVSNFDSPNDGVGVSQKRKKNVSLINLMETKYERILMISKPSTK